MERSLRIEGYRNIGFKDEKPHRERLVLNNSEAIAHTPSELYNLITGNILPSP